ncbi:unnamed protein product, partial [Choristocarpus tenellus]
TSKKRYTFRLRRSKRGTSAKGYDTGNTGTDVEVLDKRRKGGDEHGGGREGDGGDDGKGVTCCPSGDVLIPGAGPVASLDTFPPGAAGSGTDIGERFDRNGGVSSVENGDV